MEKSKEEQLRIVLKNYDVVREEKAALEKENAALKKELAQQKTLYKNMLDMYSGRHVEDWERRYKQLNDRHAEKMKKLSETIDENNRIKNMVDSVRGAICNAHNRLDHLCLSIGVEYNIKAVPNQEGTLDFRGDCQPLEKSEQPSDLNEFQNQQFIKYIRTMADTYDKARSLNGIGTMARKLKVSSISKIQFFEFGLHEKPLTDEKILKVYAAIKKQKH